MSEHCTFIPVLLYRLFSRLTVPIVAFALSLLLPRAAASELVENSEISQPASFYKPQSLNMDSHGRFAQSDLGHAGTQLSGNADGIAVRPFESLLVGLTRRMSPRRVAALRLLEKGRRLLLGGAYKLSLDYLEKSLGLDANPYVYYYLARVHFQLTHTQEALRFLDVAENLFVNQDDWMREVESLRARVLAATQNMQHSLRSVAMPGR